MGMRRRAAGPVCATDAFWQHPDAVAALRRRDLGRLFRLFSLHTDTSQTRLGEATGLSQGQVSEVMNGSRRIINLDVLERVADGLAMPDHARIQLGLAPTLDGPALTSLLRTELAGTAAGGNWLSRPLTDASTSPAPEERCLDTFEVSAIRQALQRYQAISTVLRPPAQDEPPSLARLQRQVTYAWAAFQNSRYPVLGQVIPSLLRSTQDAVMYWSNLDDHGLRARTLLSQAYQVTASTLWKLKEADLAWLAAERGLTAAEQTGDSLLISDAARRVAHGLMNLGQRGESLELLFADISRLEPGLGTASAEYLSLYGMLFLLGSVVAARDDKAGVAQELLAEGATTAARLGKDRNERYTAFGPTNVLLHRMSALIEAGNYGGAVEVATRVNPDGLAMLPRERRANFLIDTARCSFHAGRHEPAIAALLDADSMAADEVRCRPLGLSLVCELSRTQAGKSSWPLQQLVSRVRFSMS